MQSGYIALLSSTGQPTPLAINDAVYDDNSRDRSCHTLYPWNGHAIAVHAAEARHYDPSRGIVASYVLKGLIARLDVRQDSAINSVQDYCILTQP